MTRNNQPTDNARDPLADALRDEAIAERPAFSVQLHRRILQRVHEDRGTVAVHRIDRWRPLAAAAAILLVVGLMTGWMIHSRRAAMNQSVATGISTPSIAQSAASPQTSNPLRIPFELRRIMSQGVSTPVITVQLPLPRGQRLTDSPPPSPPPMSPEWLLAGLNEPATGARTTLNQMIPPEVKALLSLAPLPQ